MATYRCQVGADSESVRLFCFDDAISLALNILIAIFANRTFVQRAC